MESKLSLNYMYFISFVSTFQATDMAEASYECVLEKLRSTDRA